MKVSFDFNRSVQPAWKLHSIGILLCLLLSLHALSAQDFSNIRKQTPFKLSGNFGGDVYSGFNLPKTSLPDFSYLVYLNLTPSIYGISLPLNISYGNSALRYTHPFNSMSFTPSFKWVKLYAGRTSMNMCPYGLNGHHFDGIGIELTPDFPVEFSAMYGRLKKAVPEDSLQIAEPSFDRRGGAVKFRFKISQQSFYLHFFKAKDRPNSLPSSSSLLPQENSILTLGGDFKIIEKIHLKISSALSGFTSDLNSDYRTAEHFLSKFMGIFMKNRNSTHISSAFKAGINYSSFSLSYERILPLFYNLGADYMQNDFENLVFSGSHNFGNRLNIAAQIGWQHDDLKKSKENRMDRVVGSFNLQWNIHPEWNLQASYSNFYSYTQIKPYSLNDDLPGLENPDTLQYRQLSQNASFSFQYNSKEKKHKQSVLFNFSFQQSKEIRQKIFSNYFNSQIQHRIVLPLDYMLNSSLNFSTQITARIPPTFYFSPNVGFNKAFLSSKNLLLHCSLQWIWGISTLSSSQSLGWMTNLSYTLKKQHHFKMSIHQRLKITKQTQWNFLLQFSYQYQFMFSPDFKRGKKK